MVYNVIPSEFKASIYDVVMLPDMMEVGQFCRPSLNKTITFWLSELNISIAKSSPANSGVLPPSAIKRGISVASSMLYVTLKFCISLILPASQPT